MSVLKPTYDIGYKDTSKEGQPFTVVAYKGRKKISIEFECGTVKRTNSTLIKKGKVVGIRPEKCRIGEEYPTREGELCKVVAYRSETSMDVEFPSGVVKSYSITTLMGRDATSRVARAPIPVGTILPTNNYGDVRVVEFINSINILVEFSDGTTTKVSRECLEKGRVGHPTGGLYVGYKFKTNSGCSAEICAIESIYNISLKWEDEVVTSGHCAGNIRSGGIYYPNQKDLCGVGFFGIGKYKPNRSGGNTNYNVVAYRKWRHMITRCYNKEEQMKPSCKAYIGCVVCDDWHNFQNFALWCEDKEDKLIDGFELDKDMFGSGKLYCPEYCTLLPDEINGFLSDSYSNKDSGLPEGVNIIKPKTSGSKVGYCARCHINNVREYLGYYDSPEEAGDVYRVAKEREGRRLAEKYKDVLSEAEYLKMKNFTLEDIHRK